MEFRARITAQDGRCAICAEVMRVDEVCVDHDHQTLRIRGLLCRTCNSGIGMLKDSPELVRKALRYLESES